MHNNILIIDTTIRKSKFLFNLFTELGQKNFTFLLLSSDLNLIEQFKEKGWLGKKIYLGPILRNFTDSIVFILIFLYLSLKAFLLLIYYKFKRNINFIICVNLNEKTIFTLAAKIVGLKVIWLELPEVNYRQANKIILGLYRLNSNWADLVTFNNYTKTQLKNFAFHEERIKIIQPGIKLNQYQDNIFKNLARNNRQSLHRKYFTIGTVTDLNQKQKVEIIFQAIKICLTVIPNFQLIIIGEGNERKSLNWLAKKMEIDNLVWFVGEKNQLRKWLDSFDIFITTNEIVKLDDLARLLEAMAAGLPVIAPKNVGFEDIIYENKTGAFIEINNSEMLARQIIRLQQDKKLRLQLGENGLKRVEKYFTLDNMINNFIALFEK